MTQNKHVSPYAPQHSRPLIDPTIAKEHREQVRRNCDIQTRYELSQILDGVGDRLFSYQSPDNEPFEVPPPDDYD